MKKILIIDDDRDLLYSLSTLLTKRRYQVMAIRRGADAIGVAEVFKPSIVLLDVDLEDMDGIELCSELKKGLNTRRIPVMMMSAEINKARIREACGADDFIEKPFTLSVLYSKIEALMA